MATIFEVYDPVSSEVLARRMTLDAAKKYVADMFAEDDEPPPQWVENAPGEWWAITVDGGPADYLIFAESID